MTPAQKLDAARCLQYRLMVCPRGDADTFNGIVKAAIAEQRDGRAQWSADEWAELQALVSALRVVKDVPRI